MYRYFFCFLFFLFYRDVVAQIPDLYAVVTLNARKQPLEIILQEISKQTKIDFSYSTDKINIGNKITIRCKNKPLNKVLDEIAEKQHLRYLLVEGQIVLLPVDEKGKLKNFFKAGNRYTISGYLKDKETAEVLIAATISIKELRTGVVSNSFGFYSISLPEGDYTLVFSYIGYQTIEIPIRLLKDQYLPVFLEPAQNIMDEVMVQGSQDRLQLHESQMSEIRVSPSTFEKIPSFFGENDIIKSLHLLPGFKSFGDGSSAFFVRGGDRDQNLVVIDDAPVYNPSHLLGFFSSFIPEAVNDIKIYKGDIPVNQGSRLSSLIDIRTKDGNMREYHACGSFGIMTNSLAMEGPIAEDRSSFFISGRRSHLNWFLQRNFPDYNAYFYDVNAKINVVINSKNRLYFSAYNGLDNFKQVSELTRENMVNWMNAAGTVRWNHLFNQKLFSNTTFYASKYDYNFIIDPVKNKYWNSYIANISGKSDFTYYFLPQHTMRMGVLFTRHFFNPGNIEYGNVENVFVVSDVPVRQAIEQTWYISDEFRIRDKWSFRYGFRVPLWFNLGPTTEYTYDYNRNVVDSTIYYSRKAYHYFINTEHRVSIRYQLTDLSSLKAAFNRSFQYLHLISNSISPFTSMEIWLPSGPSIPEQRANIYILGYEIETSRQDKLICVESFYKKMGNQIEYKNHPKMYLNPMIEGELIFGKAWSYGVELLLQKKKGKLDGWLGYTYSRTFRQTESINNDQLYPAFYDRPHDINFFSSYHITRLWYFSVNWVYSTGSAITTPTGFYYYNGYTVPIYNKRNNDRLPDYHRLDFSTTIQLNVKTHKHFQHTLTFSVFNVYNRINPVFINFNKIEGKEEGQFLVPSNYYTSPELFPTSIHLLGIIPAITYNFRF